LWRASRTVDGRFGPDVLRRLDQAFGLVPEPIQPLRPREAIGVRRSFLEPIGTAESIAAVIDVLVPEACATLSARGEGARLADLLCERVDGTVQAVRIGMAAPVDDVAHLARLLKERIETIEPGFGIEAMQFVIVRAESAGVPQVAGDQAARDGRGGGRGDLACLIDRLRNRVGPEHVCRLEERASHMPEEAQAVVPFDGAGEGAGGKEDRRFTEDLPSVFFRPPRLFSPPEPIEVTCSPPDGSPCLVVWRGARHVIRAADGPERIHDEWWREAAAYGAVRDYWLAENEAGERLWLFRRGDGRQSWSGDGAWFLHGLA
jgi:protein ImuB